MPTTYRHDMPFGAQMTERGVRFRLYAPAARAVDLLAGASDDALAPHAMHAADGGWFETTVATARGGWRYAYRIDGGDTRIPDAASRFQPDGVHGTSEVVDPTAFAWPEDGWRGIAWNACVLYELHVGTFTPEGTYASALAKLDDLVRLGVTAIELMPLASFPGARNWGYDGVLPYAPTQNYGTPDELKTFVAGAHARGLAVFLDVVYNHFGPEANYLHGYAPTFYTDRHETPWGAAIDVEAEGRDDVRAYFIENALYWTHEYRFDGLRFDAVHAIYDGADRHFLRELAATVRERSDRPVHLVLENESNEASLLGDGAFRAQWADDEHHVLHVIATGETDGYYADYATDPVARLGRTLTGGFAYQGDFSEHAKKRRGESTAALPLGAFVTFVQNHDQIGNRPFGDRLANVAPEAALRAALAILLLAPSPPLLFMGEEWAASTPFQFFCDFEPELARAVTEGRRSEFGSFAAFRDPAKRDTIPDPSARETFERSRLDWSEREREPHRTWLAYYTRLLALRRKEIAPRIADARVADASFERIGATALLARFGLSGGTTLSLDANLGDRAEPRLQTSPAGRVVFATDGASTGDAWSVRWTLA